MVNSKVLSGAIVRGVGFSNLSGDVPKKIKYVLGRHKDENGLWFEQTTIGRIYDSIIK